MYENNTEIAQVDQSALLLATFFRNKVCVLAIFITLKVSEILGAEKFHAK